MAIWRGFNCFVSRLDTLPRLWEDRVAMYCAALIQDGIKSATLKSYVSGIKAMLLNDTYDWVDTKLQLSTLMQVCKKMNDRVFYLGFQSARVC